MTRKVRTFCQFREYETREFAAYLEEMAAKGRILKKISPVTGALVFEREEPRFWKFDVTVLPGSSAFVSADREEARRFRESCEAAGWQFLYANWMWQIFYTEDLQAEPVKKDLLLQLKSQKRMTLSPGSWISAVLLLFLLILRMVLDLRNPAETLADVRSLATGAVLFLVTLRLFWNMISAWIWYGRAYAMVRLNGQLPGMRLQHVRRRSFWSSVYTTALLLVLVFAVGDSAAETGYLLARGITVVAVCSLVLIWVREQGDGTFGDAVAGYVVGAVVLSVVAMMVLDVAWKQMLWPKSQEEPYERLVEWPADFEELGYRPEGYRVSRRSFLAAFQAEDGIRAGENGMKTYLYMKYYESPFSWVIRRTAENYRVDGKDEQGVAELPGRKAYTISDEHRLWYLHFSDIPNPQLIETAAEAFWDGSTAGEK